MRTAGVVDMERIVRAYPRILCASIRGELAPRVSRETCSNVQMVVSDG